MSLSIPALAATSDLGLTLEEDQKRQLDAQRKDAGLDMSDPLTAVVSLFGPQKPKTPYG